MTIDDILKQGNISKDAASIIQALGLLLAEGSGGGEDSGGAETSTGLPYNATKYAVSYYGSTNNIHLLNYYGGESGDQYIITRELTYAGGGAADNDLLTQSFDYVN